MLRLAANVSTMYGEYPLLERPAAAARDGFVAIEVQSPYGVPAAEFASALQRARMQLVLLNAPMGDASAGDRGLAAMPGRERQFEASITEALAYARALDCRRIHVMAGKPPPTDRVRARETFVRNLRIAAEEAQTHGVTLLVEPINTRDMPGYFLNTQREAAEIIDDVGARNLRLQMDFYHLQIVEGDLIAHWDTYRQYVGHVQIAGVPARREPDEGEVNYRAVLTAIDASGYDGWVGCEYRPRGATSAGLGWRRALAP